jgi:hypothetical protein
MPLYQAASLSKNLEPIARSNISAKTQGLIAKDFFITFIKQVIKAQIDA